MQLQIVNAHTLLEFSKSENIIELPCTSSKPINVMAITNIFLHIEPGYDLNINDGNLDNHKGEIAQSNYIILSLPVDQMYNNKRGRHVKTPGGRDNQALQPEG